MTGTADPERVRQIERAIRRLPRLQREIFCAIRFEDLTCEEIGVRTGLTPEEVEREFASALCHFMRLLDGKPKRWWERLWPRR